MKKKYHKVLTIAGSDCGGAAGIQADLKTFSALGCYGMSVITALTAQNTREVGSIHTVPPAFVGEQLEAIFSDMGADAVKIGMLYSAEIIEVVARHLKKHSARNIVLDPVMVAHDGKKLLQDDAVDVMKEQLIPLATVLTPNIPEASMFLNRQIRSLEDMQAAARELASWGAGSVLIKGGHMDADESVDLLFIGAEDRFVAFEGQRIVTKNDHGTGCTHSSAIASFLAIGHGMEEAAGLAKEYATGAIRAGAQYEMGRGQGPVHHFFGTWQVNS
ncbi:MAG: bifunctional hydroxymethylpyrimidine kinase/phosphomethylpyrimidine kinase [Desulfobacterales bacterium]|nr:bifunctional hydroxymethylpyrimidine kinase/phosphomethylpyrimidine kinase [Desulfobacterales bacterium]